MVNPNKIDANDLELADRFSLWGKMETGKKEDGRKKEDYRSRSTIRHRADGLLAAAAAACLEGSL